MSKNFVDVANARALMYAVVESIANTRIFHGTLDEWDALTAEEKAKYSYIATPDPVSEDVANAVTDGDMRPVTSNAVFDETMNIFSVMGKNGAKNLIPLSLDTLKEKNTSGTWSGNAYTREGITFTVNTDSSGNVTKISLQGTATASTYIVLCNKNFGNLSINTVDNPSANGYTISGGIDSNVKCMYNANNNLSSINVTSGTALSESVDVYPMIRLAEDVDDTFAPYVKTNKELTDQLKIKTIELTNQTTSSDGRLILNGQGHKMAIVSARLLNDSNNHLIVPFGFCYSTNGDALFMLADNSDNTIISSAITISGTIAYLDLS